MTVRKIRHRAAKRRARTPDAVRKIPRTPAAILEGGGASGRQGGIATGFEKDCRVGYISSPMKPRRLVSVVGMEIVSRATLTGGRPKAALGEVSTLS